VLDIDLDGMSGIDLYRIIVQRAGTAPPTVFVTGKPSAHVEVIVRALGPVGFLVKPVDAERLVQAIRRVQGPAA
jgi:DNA-binding response OmpR family regulator